MSRFEQLPNELLLDVFQYFKAVELSHIFYNLNHRLNNLIQSIPHLSLTIAKAEQTQTCILSPYVNALNLTEAVDLSLAAFPRLTRLLVTVPNDTVLATLCSPQLDNLEHLTVVSSTSFQLTYDLDNKILTGGFPKLQSYAANRLSLAHITIDRPQATALRVLKISSLTLRTIQFVLSACPNLHFLDAHITLLNLRAAKIEPHRHLKHLIVRTPFNAWSRDDPRPILTDLLSCAPHLKKLSLHQRENVTAISQSFEKYDWLSSVSPSLYSHLRRFHCYLHVFRLQHVSIVIGPRVRGLLSRFIKSFNETYKNRCPARLIVD